MPPTLMPQDRIAAGFRRRRVWQQLVILPVVLALIALVWVRESATFHEIADKDPVALGAFAVVLGGLAFSWFNWRCPGCKSSLGKGTTPEHCPGCGVSLS